MPRLIAVEKRRRWARKEQKDEERQGKEEGLST